MAKKKKASIIVPAHIFGVFDRVKYVITKVSLDIDEIEMELALSGDGKRYVKCEFDIIFAI